MPVKSPHDADAAVESNPAPVGRGIRYEPCIDGWRAVAIAMVLLTHFFPYKQPPNTWVHLGKTGVTIFFIISGYLISLILFRAKEHMQEGRLTLGEALRRFYIRRVLRIAPIYYASIAAAFVIGAPGARERIWWLVTYTSNFGQVFFDLDFKTAGHFWSLAVEEQFYLLWPLAVLLAGAVALGRTIRWLATGSLVLILVTGICGGSVWLMTMLPLGGASLALAYGALLAYGRFYENGVSPALVRISLWIGAPAFVCSQILWWRTGGMANGKLEMDQFEYKMLYVWSVVLFFGFLFVCSLNRESILNRVLSFAPLRYIGKISYGIYVYHLLLDPYFYSIWSRLGLHPTLDHFSEGLLKSATTILIAALSWHFFEKPILSLKERLAPEV